MRIAYADPPYLGQCRLYGHDHGNGHDDRPFDRRCWDDVETHLILLDYLDREFDGWAVSLTSQSLGEILPATPVRSRVAAWVKPFAAYKRNVRIAYAWEPVLWSPARDRSADGAPVGRDYLAEPITLRRGFTGAKPDRFHRWILDLLGYLDGADQLVDLFPGSGGMGRVLTAPPLELVFTEPETLW